MPIYGALPATAASLPDDAGAAIDLLVERLSPNAADRVEKVSIPSDYSIRAADFEVALPTSQSASVVLSQPQEIPLGVRPLFALDSRDSVGATDTANYVGENSKNLFAVEVFGSGVQFSEILLGPEASHAFVFAVDVPNGGRLEQLSSGAVAVWSAAGSFVGGFASAWARDSRGHAVETYYEVQNGFVIQNVSVQASDACPIVADPWLFKDLIDSASWIYRKGVGFTLSVSPSGWLRAFAGSYPAGSAAWDELYDKYRARGLTVNLGGMRDQLICHVQIAAFKTTYNLDEWRSDVGYAQTLNSKCNPGGGKFID